MGNAHPTDLDTMTTHLRSDYTPFPYDIPTTDLLFDLKPELTTVTLWLEFERKNDEPVPLVLNGEHITLQFISLNNEETPLDPSEYTVTDSTLTLHNPPESGMLHIITTCTPNTNTSLSGLFTTGVHLMTQCEAEGFRRMAYFPDRPDVLSTYTVELIADKAAFPVLLSNGNLIETRDLPNGGHMVTWHDPFPKPSYLFAVVAGQLACLEETITQDGAEKLLQVYVEPHDLPKAQFAMDSLKASIRWDKARFGLPLDLERFMIVATSDFNMGAMENKGLNIFNTKFVLAHPETATDVDFEGVEAVVGHEYFHNWTGNRVTCQDWFQLSLKEGLTVYRDQEFSSDQLAEGLSPDAATSARAVKRIDDVAMLRTAQFMEDAGPMAHPIRPNAYEEINNFYTMTVYEKGAEVVRMYETLLGRDGFRRGMDLYFKRHDGQAVTCDDFRAAMADANQADLTQFGRWYEQAGTPTVRVTSEFDANAQTYTLHFAQSNPPVGIELKEANLIKAPLHIPLRVALLGTDIDTLIELKQANESITFENITAEPTPSLNRNFSAPVSIEYDYSDDQLATLAATDTDAFNRWDAVQQIFARAIVADMLEPVFSHEQFDTFRSLLTDESLSPAYRAQLFTLPSFSYLAQLVSKCEPLDPQKLFAARERASRALSKQLQIEWQSLYSTLEPKTAYAYNGVAAGERALRNLALRHISSAKPDTTTTQYAAADNMTDRIAALTTAIHEGQDEALLNDFYNRFEKEALVIDKWFTAQAANPHDANITATLQKLLAHPAFTNPNPNRLRSLVFAFCNANPAHFHATDGSGYRFWAEQVLAIDAKNPQVASRLARTLEQWRTYAEPYQSLMREALQTVFNAPNLSQDVREIVGKALG
ncbi:aminopeptidase N [Formosimonas limnophila]|uniref:Aminopeptidase N n=2 Tax=Formosimonas limnophila TaxID=1384487 RepID=A0A8J3FZ41_9BURK|nr:aminopeptidase N [Formosimonas limnophila]